MRKTYPEFIENALRDNFTNFANIGRDRWNTFEIDGYRKLSDVLKKNLKIHLGNAYMSTILIYIS